MPILFAVLMTRHAISPLLAINILSNGGLDVDAAAPVVENLS